MLSNSGSILSIWYPMKGIINALNSMGYNFKPNQSKFLVNYPLETKHENFSVYTSLLLGKTFKYIESAMIYHAVYSDEVNSELQMLTVPLIHQKSNVVFDADVSGGRLYFTPKKDFTYNMADTFKYIDGLDVLINPKREYNNHLKPFIIDFVKYVHQVENNMRDILVI